LGILVRIGRIRWGAEFAGLVVLAAAARALKAAGTGRAVQPTGAAFEAASLDLVCLRLGDHAITHRLGNGSLVSFLHGIPHFGGGLSSLFQNLGYGKPFITIRLELICADAQRLREQGIAFQ